MKIKQMVLCSILFLQVHGYGQDTLYVAVNGSSSGTGTRQAPLGSVAEALLRARTITSEDTVHINVGPGTYLLKEPVHISEKDQHRIVIEGDPDHKPLLSGGISIAGWERTKEGWWRCKVPEVVRYGFRFEQLYVNGVRATRARTPDTGWFFVDSAKESIQHRGTGRVPEYATQVIFTRPANLHTLRKPDPEDPEIVAGFYHKWDYTRKPVVFLDRDSGRLFTGGTGMASWNPLQKGSRFILENYKAALTAPGEWFLGRTGYLYYIPREGEKMETAEAYAPALTQLVTITGTAGHLVKDKIFRNISFAHAADRMPAGGNDPMQAAAEIDAAIRVDWAENIVFENCEVMHTGNYAFWLRRAVKNSTITHSFIYDAGGGGIKIGETGLPAEGTPLTERLLIENNIIRHIGMLFPNAVGIVVFNAANNRILHNVIADSRYTGISLGWMWGYTVTKQYTTYLDAQGRLQYANDKALKNPSVNNEVAYNEIHHIGWGELSDMGAVYTLAESPGTHIHNNVIHDVYAYDYGGWGLYTDEGSSDILLEDNLVYACKSGGFHQHYGRNNTVRNNIFAFGHLQQLDFTRVEPHRSFSFTNNIILMDHGTMFHGPWDKGNILMEENCYWSMNAAAPLFMTQPFSSWRQHKDKGALFADPLFKDPLHGDFSFKSLKTARKIHFRPFDYKKAGVYGSGDWIRKSKMSGDEINAFRGIIREREKSYSAYYR
ncbi:right-handed parallel beta-helix repeat-containing protein [Niabella drilacis]|nr:right-handed parallel beta-helix repeat-containing protein [Niabella drilacis]